MEWKDLETIELDGIIFYCSNTRESLKRKVYPHNEVSLNISKHARLDNTGDLIGKEQKKKEAGLFVPKEKKVICLSLSIFFFFFFFFCVCVCVCVCVCSFSISFLCLSFLKFIAFFTSSFLHFKNLTQKKGNK